VEGLDRSAEHPRVVEFDDSEVFAAALKRVDLEVLQTGRGVFKATHVAFAVGACDVQAGAINQPIFARGASDPTRVGFLLELRKSRDWSWYGQSMGEASVGVCSGGCELLIRADRNTQWAFISAAPDILAQCADSVYGRELRVPARGPVLIRLQKLEAAVMSDLLSDSMIAIRTRGPQRSRFQSLTERALLRSMVRMLLGEVDDIGRSELARFRSLMTRVNYFMAAHPEGAVRLEDLCTASGVSAEIMRSMFRRYIGLDPLPYLLTRRLNQVRKALIRADPATTAVADIARAWGFSHLASFTRQFTELFGRTPSAVLHRSSRLSV